MSTSRSLLLLLTLTGALLALLLLLNDWGLEEATSEMGFGAANSPASESASSSLQHPETDTAGSVARNVVEQQSASDVEPWPEEGPLWTVVDAHTGDPCPAALVAMLVEPADPVSAWELRCAGAAPSEIVRRLGRRFRCDARGRVRLPRFPHDQSLVCAWAEERQCLTAEYIADRDGSLSIRSPILRVRVVDPSGEPCAGVPVGVHRGTDIEWGPVELVWTDREGLASFRSRAFEIEDHDYWTVAPGWPLSQESPRVLPGRPFAAEAKILRIPPSGSLLVRVRDPRGRVPQEIRVALEPPNEDVRKLRKPIWDSPDAIWVDDRGGWLPRAPATDGEVRFPRVGLGLRFDVVVSAKGLDDTTVEVAGPKRAGEVVTVDVELHPPPALVASLVDSNGLALAGLHYEAATGEGRPIYAQYGTTGANGGIRYLRPRWEEGVEPWLKVVLKRLDGEGYPTVVHGARWLVQRHEKPGDLDLGTLVVPTDDVVLSGIVVDQDGSPVERADVGFDSADREDPVTWFDPFWPFVCTDAEGQFCVTGGFEDVPNLVVGARGAEDDQGSVGGVLFTRGTRGLRIQLTRFGELTSEIRIPTAMDDHPILPELAPYGGRAETEFKGEDRLALHWKGLPPGTYEFALFVGEHDEAIAHVPGIEIRGGEVNRDPRIDAIDVRGRLRSVAIQALSKDGGPVLSLEAWRMDLGPEPVPLWTDAYGTRVVVADEKPAVVWLASPPHHRLTKKESVLEDCTVELERAMWVYVELDGLPVEDDILVWPSLAADHPGPRAGGYHGYNVEQGAAYILAWCPGPWKVSVEVDDITVGGGPPPPPQSARRTAQHRPPVFMVADKALQQVRLRFDQAAYEEALAEKGR